MYHADAYALPNVRTAFYYIFKVSLKGNPSRPRYLQNLTMRKVLFNQRSINTPTNMNEKILIVEDEMIVATDLRLVLERNGY